MPDSPAGWLLTIVVGLPIVAFLADGIARRLARRGDEPPPIASPPKKTVSKDRGKGRPARPHRVQTSAARPRQPVIAVSTAPSAPPVGQLLTKRDLWRLFSGCFFVLMFGCVVLGFRAERSNSRDRDVAEATARTFVAALETGDRGTATRLWFGGGSMPFYDLTGCRDVNRRTTSTVPQRNLPIVVTRVDYDSECVIGPGDERFDRIYVEASTYSVFYIGHERP